MITSQVSELILKKKNNVLFILYNQACVCELTAWLNDSWSELLPEPFAPTQHNYREPSSAGALDRASNYLSSAAKTKTTGREVPDCSGVRMKNRRDDKKKTARSLPLSADLSPPPPARPPISGAAGDPCQLSRKMSPDEPSSSVIAFKDPKRGTVGIQAHRKKTGWRLPQTRPRLSLPVKN